MLKKLCATAVAVLVGIGVLAPAAGAAPTDLGWWTGKDGSAHCVVDWATGDFNCDGYPYAGGHVPDLIRGKVPFNMTAYQIYFSGGAAGTDTHKVTICGNRAPADYDWVVVYPTIFYQDSTHSFRRVKAYKYYGDAPNGPEETAPAPNQYKTRHGVTVEQGYSVHCPPDGSMLPHPGTRFHTI